MRTRSAFVVLVSVALALLGHAARAEAVLITGANAGLGLEFTKQYAARGATVIATHRRDRIPDTLAAVVAEYPNVRVERMDISVRAEIDALAAKLADVPIDILINNAAIWTIGDRNDPQDRAAQAFGTLDYDQFELFMRTNVAGPIRVAEAFIEHVKAGRTTELEDDGVTVLLFHPGGVRTERLAALGSRSTLAPEESIGDMIAVIDKITMADTGRFLSHDGQEMPW